MAQTTTIIVGLCLVGIVTWTVLLWSRQRVLRTFLVISAAFHGVLLAIPLATGRSAPDEHAAPRLIPYTIIQGADAPTAETAELELPDEQPPTDTIDLAHKPLADPLEDDETQADSPPPAAVDANLPRIEHTAWFAFDDHPGAVSYRRELQRLIQRHFEVPKELDERGYEGRLKVWLNLSHDGTLNYAFLDPHMRSEDDEINRLTEQNLKKMADKFPPFPEGVKDYDVNFFVIIDYRNLRNR